VTLVPVAVSGMAAKDKTTRKQRLRQWQDNLQQTNLRLRPR